MQYFYRNSKQSIRLHEQRNLRCGMKVLVGESVYETNRKGLQGILKVASKQIPRGIYAVEKDDYCELRKDKFESKKELKKAIAKYIENGFKVHYNS